MPARKDKLSLFLFIDAFGWEIKRRHPEFLKGLVADSRKLETILGYSSACDPSIISGLLPNEHGLWSSFYYDPDRCPYPWVKYLRILPDALSRRSRVRRHLARLIKKVCGFTGYFQIYAVPFDVLPLFNYAEQKRIWEPGGLPHGKTIFDRLSESGIPYYVHDSDVGDGARLDRLLSDIRNRRIDFAYCSLGRLDALMHAVGNDDPQIDRQLQWYDGQIRTLLTAAAENYREVSWYVFTDHGMHNVVESCDLIAAIARLGLVWNRDYAAFYDSTMARIWILDEKARSPIIAALSSHPQGRILPEAELRELGVWFEDGRYGDIVFLLNSGIQMVPSFMGVSPLKGLHGYHPADADSYASLSSNRTIPADIASIRHIHRLMLDELGLP